MPLIESSGRWHLRSTRNDQWTASDSTVEDMEIAIPLKYNSDVIDSDAFPEWEPKAIEEILDQNRALWIKDNGRVNYWTLDDNWNQTESQRLRAYDSFGNLISYVAHDENLDLGHIIYRPEDGFFTVLRNSSNGRRSSSNQDNWKFQAVEKINRRDRSLWILNNYERVNYHSISETGQQSPASSLDIVETIGNLAIFRNQDEHYLFLNKGTSLLAHFKSRRNVDIAPSEFEGFGLLAAETVNGENHAIKRNRDQNLTYSHIVFDDDGRIVFEKNITGFDHIDKSGNILAFETRKQYLLYKPESNDLLVLTKQDGRYLASNSPGREGVDLLAAEEIDGITYAVVKDSDGKIRQYVISDTGQLTNTKFNLKLVELAGNKTTYKRNGAVIILGDPRRGDFAQLKNLGSDVPPSDYSYLDKLVATDQFDTERLALWKAKSGRHHLWRMDENWNRSEGTSMFDIDVNGNLHAFKEDDLFWIYEPAMGHFSRLDQGNRGTRRGLRPVSAETKRNDGYESIAVERVDFENKIIFWNKNDWTLTWSLDSDFNRSSVQGINSNHGDINADEVVFQSDLNRDGITPEEVIENVGNASVFGHPSGKTLIASENYRNSDLRYLAWTSSAAEDGFYPGKGGSNSGTGGLKPGGQISNPRATGIGLKPGKGGDSIPYVMPHRVWNAKAAEELDGDNYVVFVSSRSKFIRVYQTVRPLLGGDSWAIGDSYESVRNNTTRYQELEKQFGVDFDDDGFSDNYIEEKGEVSLGMNNSEEYIVINDGKVYETGLFDHAANWSLVREGEGHSRLARGSKIYGAETINGINFLVTGNLARTRFSLQTVDSEWKSVDNGSKKLYLNTISFGRMEDSFMQDVDQDLITGLQFNVIEEKGYSALLENENKYYIAGQSWDEWQDNPQDPEDLQIEPLLWEGSQLTKERIRSLGQFALLYNFRGVELDQRTVRDLVDPSISLGPYLRKSLAMTIDWIDRPTELIVYSEYNSIDGSAWTPDPEVETFTDGPGGFITQETIFRQDFNESNSVGW